MLSQVSTFTLVLAALVGLIIGLLICRILVGKASKQKRSAPEEILQEGYGEVARLWYSADRKQMLAEMEGDFFRDFDELNAVQQAKALKLLEIWKTWVKEDDDDAELGGWQRPFQASTRPGEDVAWAQSPRMSVTRQINAILQETLAETEFAEKNVSIEENSESGLDVWIDGEKYSGLENVPSALLKSQILKAAQRWRGQAGV